jgi:hypothetical protein
VTPRQTGVEFHNLDWKQHIERGLEIQQWMDTNSVDSDMGHLLHYLVQTDCAVGLQDEHIGCAVALLTPDPYD